MQALGLFYGFIQRQVLSSGLASKDTAGSIASYFSAWKINIFLIIVIAENNTGQ